MTGQHFQVLSGKADRPTVDDSHSLASLDALSLAMSAIAYEECMD